MSINSVPVTGPFDENPSVGPASRETSPSVSPQDAAVSSPNSAAKPKSETHENPRAPSTLEIPQDEVRVQRDNGVNGQIIIKYVDAGGDLILQIPSSQVLGLARAIEQALEEQAKAQAGVASQSPITERG